jgi:hypothetical protein
LGDPQRIRGVALRGFESGSFHPAPNALPAGSSPSDFWLSLEPRLLPPELRKRCADGCKLALDFIGRRSVVEGGYGHMGLAKHLIVVDQIIAAKVVD